MGEEEIVDTLIGDSAALLVISSANNVRMVDGDRGRRTGRRGELEVDHMLSRDHKPLGFQVTCRPLYNGGCNGKEERGGEGKEIERRDKEYLSL